jgi:hypothetical protein
MTQNFSALELWLSVQTQWRGGFSLIGLDYNVLYQEAARLEIDLSPCMMSKIQALERHVLKNQGNKDAKRNNQGSQQAKAGFKDRKPPSE